MGNKKRISLLSDVEVDEIYARPQFTDADRDYFFQLGDKEHKLLKKYTNLKSKVFFILQNGYFSAKKKFFKFTIDDVIDDVAYIIKKHYAPTAGNKKLTGSLWKEVNREQKSAILKLHGYKEGSIHLEKSTRRQLEGLVRLHPKGSVALRELLVFFDSEKIVAPSYRTLQDLLTGVFKTERQRLDAIIMKVPDSIKKQLDEIIQNDNGLTELNVIRMDQKDFSYSALKLEVKKARKIALLYRLCKTLVPSLGLSNNAVRYYASLTEQYAAYRLRKLKKPQQYLQILCFIFNRYQEFMDNLITSLMFHLRAFRQEGKEYADTKESELVKSVIQELPHVGQFFSWFANKDDAALKHNMSIEAFKQIGFNILPKDKQIAIADLVWGSGFNKKSAQWDYYEKQSRRIAMYFRPILLAVDFEFYKTDSLIMQLIDALRAYYSSHGHHATLIQSIPAEVMEKVPGAAMVLLKKSDNPHEISASRFEFYVYEKIYHQIDRGRLFCNDSVSYCNLDDDLVPDEFVDKADEICGKLGYHKIPVYCDERLDQALNELESAWIRTNQNIENGANIGIKIEIENGFKTWKLTYDANTKETSTFFDELPKTEIADVMKFMGDLVKIWKLFECQKDRYIKVPHPSPSALVACILADAFGFDIEKMSQMSNIGYNHLRTVDENFMYVENLKLVNDAFANYTHGLPVSRVWDLIEDTVVADADGQKYETSRHTIQSRHSSKFFGEYKGISIYSLTANHISVNAKAIGPNEHESHHLYDLIFNNETNIPIHMVTGDGHSINQTSFVTLDSINVEFVPSINSIREEAEKLYSVHDPDQYQGLIKPHAKIKRALIKSEKRGIIRILLSLLLQKSTQAVIIRKLASHKRYSRLQAAFWEYNKIFKSTHVLNLIDDENKRKIFKTARNRSESYHQFHRMIRKVFSGVFKGRRIVSNAISLQASRLVSNCVIAYNAMLLNELYLRLCSTVGEEKAKAIVRHISPVAWQHIIFTGRYHFKDQVGQIDFEKMIALLEEKLRKIR